MLLKTWVSLLKKVFLWFFMLALWCIKDKYYINRWLFLWVILVPRWLHYFIWFANPNLLTWYSKQYNLWITSPPHVFLTWYLLLKSTNAEHLGTRKKQISQDYSTWCWIHHGQEEEERGKWKIWKTDGLKLYNSSSWQYRCVAWNTSLSFLLFIISCRKKKNVFLSVAVLCWSVLEMSWWNSSRTNRATLEVQSSKLDYKWIIPRTCICWYCSNGTYSQRCFLCNCSKYRINHFVLFLSLNIYIYILRWCYFSILPAGSHIPWTLKSLLINQKVYLLDEN